MDYEVYDQNGCCVVRKEFEDNCYEIIDPAKAMQITGQSSQNKGKEHKKTSSASKFQDYISILESLSEGINFATGEIIEGLDEVESDVYHMGTRIVNGKYTVNGGRVLIVVGTGKTLKEAQEKALEDVKKIKCDSLFYRSDIGYRAL
jgi:phosphoribosylamine-glycine ligase